MATQYGFLDLVVVRKRYLSPINNLYFKTSTTQFEPIVHKQKVLKAV